MSSSKFHQVHFTLPIDLYNELIEIIPKHGNMSSIFRTFATAYVAEYKAQGAIQESPFDKAVKASMTDIVHPLDIKEETDG